MFCDYEIDEWEKRLFYALSDKSKSDLNVNFQIGFISFIDFFNHTIVLFCIFIIIDTDQQNFS